MNVRLRVCILNTTLNPGGAEKQMINLIKHWSKHPDISIEIYTILKDKPWANEVENITSLKVLTDYSLEQIRHNRLKKFSLTFEALYKFNRYIKKKRPDIILTFLWYPTLLACLANNKIPIVWSVQSSIKENLSQKVHKNFLKFLLKKIANYRVKKFLPISKGLYKELKVEFNLDDKKMCIIPNSINIEEIRCKAKFPLENFFSKKNKFRLVSVGNLKEAKGFDVLLKAVSLLPQSIKKNIEVYIVGDGEKKKELFKLRNSLDLCNIVIFTGMKENPYPFLSSSDVFISTSKWEAFGIAMLEAMALGLPVIATATYGAKDLILHRKNGILVPINDTHKIAESIKELYFSEELRRKLSKEALKTALRYDIKNIAAKYEEVIRNVLKGG